MKKQLALGAVGAILIALAAFFLGSRINFHAENQKPGKFPEQLVYVRSADDVVGVGALFTSTSSPSKPLAIIWVHGWGANFYTPSYVGIGRELAERGFPTISVNTRMHDIGNVEKYTLLGMPKPVVTAAKVRCGAMIALICSVCVRTSISGRSLSTDWTADRIAPTTRPGSPFVRTSKVMPWWASFCCQYKR